MVQVLDENKERNYSIVLKEIIIIEEPPIEKEQPKLTTAIKLGKPTKKSLLKLLKKSKYNANYLKEIRRIEDVKNKLNIRNYAIY
ncbi:MAG: hypothetical protein ACFE9C_08160 [Candidatus Hodarchaeota archaeon]